jgi:hypothetical protein
MLLTLSESIDVSVDLQSWENVVTSEIEEKAESYDISWDVASQKTILSLFDTESNKLCAVRFENPMVAIGVLEELFDIGEEDLDELYSFNWVPEDYAPSDDLDGSHDFDGNSNL